MMQVLAMSRHWYQASIAYLGMIEKKYINSGIEEDLQQDIQKFEGSLACSGSQTLQLNRTHIETGRSR
jgi:hypothetical protein